MHTTMNACALLGISQSYFRKVAKQLGYSPTETKVYREGNLKRTRHYWSGTAVYEVMMRLRNRKRFCETEG